MVEPIPTRRASEGTGGASRTGHGQRPSLARFGVARFAPGPKGSEHQSPGSRSAPWERTATIRFKPRPYPRNRNGVPQRGHGCSRWCQGHERRCESPNAAEPQSFVGWCRTIHGIVRPTECHGRFGGPRRDFSRLGATLQIAATPASAPSINKTAARLVAGRSTARSARTPTPLGTL